METELKFQIPRGQGAAVARDLAGAPTTRLQALYVDTAGRHLAQAAMALRLRQEGRRWVQTLKGRGDGLLQRLEHEVNLPPGAVRRGGSPLLAALDLARHDGDAAGQRLRAVLAAAGDPPLVQVYRTDITRRHRQVRHGGAVIEIAHDRGYLIAGEGDGERRLRVDEVEFELVKGPASALPALASRWVLRHGLWWDCRTKSERGQRLALGPERVPPRPVGAPRTPRHAAAWRLAVLEQLAETLPNGAELASDLALPGHAEAWCDGLAALGRLLQLKAAPPEAASLAAQWPAGDGAPTLREPALNAALLALLGLTLAA